VTEVKRRWRNEQDGATLHYYIDVRHLFDVHFPGTWTYAKVKCGVSIKIARPNAIRLCPVGALKNVVYTSEPGCLKLKLIVPLFH
jgi:hypothetical protein